jgi:hypothetical protein
MNAAGCERAAKLIEPRCFPIGGFSIGRALLDQRDTIGVIQIPPKDETVMRKRSAIGALVQEGESSVGGDIGST